LCPKTVETEGNKGNKEPGFQPGRLGEMVRGLDHYVPFPLAPALYREEREFLYLFPGLLAALQTQSRAGSIGVSSE
jgi:hypothetical protein